MAHREITFNKRKLTIHKASINPDINQPTVLVTDTWDYVDLWLKRESKEKARFFWQQARNFYDASLLLDKDAAPLTLYYCFLNATKTLLEAKNLPYNNFHGVSGQSLGNITTLDNEEITIKSRGVLPALAEYLQQPFSSGQSFSLYDCLYNIPVIHRAFLLTYTNNALPELFIPVHNPLIVKSNTNDETWFCAEMDKDYSSTQSLKKLPSNFQRDTSYNNTIIIRCKSSPKRIRWKRTDRITKKIADYKKYNQGIRRHLFYIHGFPTSWYIKRSKNNNPHYLDFSPLVLSLSAMHRLSELARYTPDKLAKHFECKQNWLLNEFIKSVPIQFIDEISSEITGMEFKIPKNAVNLNH